MWRWRRAKSLLAACAAAFLMVGGSVMAAAPAQANVTAEVSTSVAASATVNQPLVNSGCFPSGLSRNYKVITFRTTSILTGSFRAAVAPENGDVVAALYDGAFTPENTVARCLKRTVGAVAGGNASIYWSAAASTDATDAHTWSLVLFADAAAGTVDAAVSVTSNGTVSFDGQPLTLQAEEFDAATQGEKFLAQVSSVNGTPPYKYSASGFPDGISIDEVTGAVTGTPAEAGDFTPIIRVIDSAGTPMTASKSLPLAVAAEDVVEPTEEPTEGPTVDPTVVPTVVPTTEPTVAPTADPTTVPTTPAASVPAETTSAAATPLVPETSAAPETSAETAPETAPGTTPAIVHAEDKLPVTGAAVAIPAVVGVLVLGAGLVLTVAMCHRRPRHN